MKKYVFDDLEIKRFIAEGKTAHEIVAIKGYSRWAMYDYLDRKGLKTVRPRSARRLLSVAEDMEMVRQYTEDGLSADHIANEIGVNRGVVYGSLRRLGIKRRLTKSYRLYRMDESFFDVIDTERKAYFLGLLFADGCCMRRDHTYSSSWLTHLGLHKKDKYMVEAFRDAVFPDRDAPVRPARNQVRIVVNSQRIFESLGRLGCVPRKSLILRFPSNDQVPEEMMRHFIRGCFDGDGCICIANNRSLVSIAGSVTFCQPLAAKLSAKVGYFGLTSPKGNPLFKTIQTGKKSTLVSFYRYIYEGATIFLERKRLKYDTFILSKSPESIIA